MNAKAKQKQGPRKLNVVELARARGGIGSSYHFQPVPPISDPAPTPPGPAPAYGLPGPRPIHVQN